jgi:hypothetical protein
MLIHKDFIFVCNPRTASRATKQALKDILGDSCYIAKQHHVKTGHPALKLGLPIHGVIRNPLHWLVSWSHHMQVPADGFSDFIHQRRNEHPLYSNGLNIYRSYITETHRYEDGVLEIVRKILGMPKLKMAIPVIGKTGAENNLWNPELIAEAKRHWPLDFEPYQL